ncbi:MAG: hypothetical protein ACK53Y_09500, partial [bacterium]
CERVPGDRPAAGPAEAARGRRLARVGLALLPGHRLDRRRPDQQLLRLAPAPLHRLGTRLRRHRPGPRRADRWHPADPPRVRRCHGPPARGGRRGSGRCGFSSVPPSDSLRGCNAGRSAAWWAKPGPPAGWARPWPRRPRRTPNPTAPGPTGQPPPRRAPIGPS